MPFDTTYYINANKNNTAGYITFRGGIDTSIFLEPGQFPSQLDSSMAGKDSIFLQKYLELITEQHSFELIEEEKNNYNTDYAPLIFFLIALTFFIFKSYRRVLKGESWKHVLLGDNEPVEKSQSSKKKSYLTYYGNEIKFTDAEVAAILSKRFLYYRQLNLEYQAIFIRRLQKFMAEKTFKIHDEKGFKEMPVLISAAAIQVSFGLKKYLLPHFEFIHIHPQEFLRVQPILCFLEGNVSGHAIRLSWKHFIDGYTEETDGQNVGLHELAHALYYQSFIVERNVDRGFRNYYDGFSANGDKAWQSEKTKEKNLYSEYAEKNLQEFWAESVELFFEKPKEMRSEYPQLYESMKSILNQDPINHIPVLSS